MRDRINYSIIVPVYCNEDSLENLYIAILNDIVIKNPNITGEIIFIDDGSTDNSFNKLLELKNNYKDNNIRLKIVKLTRNFGQIFAIQSGYFQAKGECIINIAADLQDPPRVINKMLNYHFKEEYDIVIAARKSRKESLFRKITSQIFYWLINKLSFKNMPKSGFDIVLINDKVKNYILDLNESDPFWQGQILWSGYNTKFIKYEREKRQFGKSKWTFTKKIKYLIDGVMGYSFFPIRMITFLGILISLSGFIYAGYIFVLRLTTQDLVYGWAPLMIVILLLGGFQMLMLGIIGEYVWRTLSQARNRPKFIIDKIIE
jgi:polyisoprenyl-phosphate glycosyltransferase